MNNNVNQIATYVEPIGYVRLEQVLRLIPVSKSTWWNGVKSGRFPKSYKVAPRITVWKMSDIQDCMNGFGQSNNV